PRRGMQRPVRKPAIRMVLVGLESNRHLALDGFAVWSKHLRCAQAGEPGHALNVPLPAAERDGPAAVHQEAIAGIDLVSRGHGCRARRKSVERHANALAAVDYVRQEAAVRRCRVLRLPEDRGRGFAFAGSFGCRSTKSASKRTTPLSSCADLSRSTMAAFAACSGSTAKCKMPSMRS